MPDLEERSTPIASPSNGNLQELQALLLKTERDRLDRLEAEQGRVDRLEDDLNQLDDHLKNKVVDASSVAKVLPDAIRQRSDENQPDQPLEESLEPIFTATFGRAVKRSRDIIAEAISPVMMPAIRKAIASAMEDIAQSMNRTLDHRRLVWRWESWRTGRPFWEVVLAHTVKYQVERVFLFFKEDGVHLLDVHRHDIPPFELGKEDLVSSMFSAIQTAVQKFAQDEFQASEDASCKTFEWDDGTKVWIEHGPKAVLAAVVRGVPPPSLRPALRDALDSIHWKLEEALQNFRGDKKAFEASRSYLESCLLQEKNDPLSEAGSARGLLSPAFVVVLMLLLITLVWGITVAVTSYFERQRWADFQDKAREKPGIHITSINRADGIDGKTIVFGLRDPLSDEPQKIAQEVGLSAEAIDFQLEPYLSLAPELIERRTRDNRLHLDQLVREIEEHQFDFEAGSTSLVTDSDAVLQKLRQALRKSDTLALQLGNRIRVEIHGNTSDEGSAEMNQRLALARAQRILSVLNVERFPATDFVPVAESVGPLTTAETQGAKPLRARQVSFHVMVDDSGSAGPRP
jgi:OOP family OmpA-OmpF porin